MPDVPQTTAAGPTTTPPVTPSEPESSTGNSKPAAQTTIASSVENPEGENPKTQQTLFDETPKSWLWLNKHDQKFVGVFVALFLALSGYHWATLGGWGMQPIEIDRLPERQYDFRIDINSASWVEWTQIEGIGEVTAQKIIADRDSNGAFKSIDDLLRIKGIGPKTLAKMRPYLREPNAEGDPPKQQP